MHLLAATPGTITDGSEAVDLGQTPGDIVILSAADTELSGLAQARAGLGEGFPSLRLANLMQLGHNLSVDLYVEDIIAEARIVVIRLLGGAGYWSYGVERIAAVCRAKDIALAVVPGDDQPDPELSALCTVPQADWHRIWHYLVHGGAGNFASLLRFAGSHIGHDSAWAEPAPLVRAGLYWPGHATPDLDTVRKNWTAGAPVAAITFYRALVQAGNTAPVDALIAALAARGLNPLPMHVASLKDPVCAEIIADLLGETAPKVILNATGFAISSPGAERSETPFDGPDCPILQVIFSGGTEDAWRAGTHGLSARDIAMNVALPEVDGRILSRAVSFKAEAAYDDVTQCSLATYRPVADRVDFVAELASRWATLAATPAAERRVAIVLANYPTRDGRLGNGVGLDTPAGVIETFRALGAAGYHIEDVPETGNALMKALSSGPTNAPGPRSGGAKYSAADYQSWFDRLPAAVREAVTERWGAPDQDPFHVDGAFVLPVRAYGNIIVGIQLARGYHIDPKASYHDPDLVPPHGYLAFYAWLREGFAAHAVIHMGKHGNMEWLPGKALALSEECFPEAAFGPMPHLYPFIVNDPGEGTQAKRRSQAVIIDHLTPPMTRAESYGDLADLERLVDEYYDAAGVDPRRLALLRDDILDLTRSSGLDVDCGIARDDSDTGALAKLDTYLCELKEMQIRDGLHIFGVSPTGRQLADLLVALVRVPRGDGAASDASLNRALAADLDLEDFDPLDCIMGDPWTGPRPDTLAKQDTGAWRTAGDTVERLEMLASQLVSGNRVPEKNWPRATAVLDALDEKIRPAVDACGESEIAALLRALDGRFVAPGPSGAPTRGRPDVLPTGRNFYSVDTRTVPTPAAWRLGWQSATLLLDHHRQTHGTWPTSLALSAWGTSNMRTGGDDIAQALALMGVQPKWDAASRRLTGFEIMPASVLDRPRVDVTFRVSGFFRDAFPAQIDLLDSAVRAVAALDESPEINPLAARVRADTDTMVAKGTDPEAAGHRAAHRVFGSKPGAYGAGLQALIDERGWDDEADLARAYLAWGGYAYGSGSAGTAEHGLFESRLKSIDAVVQNQDNREHDLLDSDDYYQFEGGLTATVRHLSGEQPATYHNDHSRPETPRIRTLEDEIGRVVRARVVNPKWIAGVMRHGYKGAFEMAATVDYMFAFAATARCVRDHHFDAVYDAYLGDARVHDFLQDNNPAAAREIAERLLEAQERNLWKPRSNTAGRRLAELAGREMT
jgi:cobaltochelatase CobN